MSSKQNKIPQPAPIEGAQELPTRWVRVSHHNAQHMTQYAYAAFGSNLMLAQMGERCPEAEIVGPGRLYASRLIFARVASIVADASAFTPIGVYRLSASDIESLDRKEGLGKAYDRYLVTVTMEDGVALRCFTYIKRDNRLAAPSEAYYKRLVAGYKDWKFPDRRPRRARKRSEKGERRAREYQQQSARDARTRIPEKGSAELKQSEFIFKARYKKIEYNDNDPLEIPKSLRRERTPRHDPFGYLPDDALEAAYRDDPNVFYNPRTRELWQRGKGSNVWKRKR